MIGVKYFGNAIILYALLLGLCVQENNALAEDTKTEHCATGMSILKSGYDLGAETDSEYLRISFGSPDTSNLMYVMPKKTPYRGKAYYVEFMSTACMTASLHLRADDGATAIITFMLEGVHCEPCLSGKVANIIWNDPKAPAKQGQTVFFRYAGSAENYFDTPKEIEPANTESKKSELELKAVILATSRNMCTLEINVSRGKNLDSCVMHRTGLSEQAFKQLSHEAKR